MEENEVKETLEEAHTVGNIAVDQLMAYVNRIENLEEEKSNLANDISEVYAEVKSTGLDVKTLKQIIRLRKMEEDERQETEFLLGTYKRALDMD